MELQNMPIGKPCVSTQHLTNFMKPGDKNPKPLQVFRRINLRRHKPEKGEVAVIDSKFTVLYLNEKTDVMPLDEI